MKRLYVNNVSSKSDEKELREMFEECGKLKFFGVKDGAGYIEYETPEEANECLKKYENFELLGKTLTVEMARKFKSKPPFRASGRRLKREYRRSSSNSRSESKSSSSRSRSHRKKKSKKRERSRSHSKSVSRSDSRSRSRSRNHKKNRK